MATVYFDTKCSFCSGIVERLRDRALEKGVELTDIKSFNKSKYSPINGDNLSHADSLIVVDDNTVSLYSGAVISFLIHLGGIYKFCGYLLKTIPKVIRDRLYKIIAKHRYGIFGIK